MDFTSDQLKAINSPDNVLVMAGAGTGKTRTLVEHCVRQLLDHRISIEQMLLLTFTEGAAAEMRERIGSRLQQKLAEDPSNPLVHEQLALLGVAQISTLHSYCYKLIREYFDQLGHDPGVTVLTSDQARAIQMESFDELRDRYFSEDSSIAARIREFVEANAVSGEKKLRSIVEAIHSFTQARPQPGAWIERQLKLHEAPEPSEWHRWFREGLSAWAVFWLDCARCEPAFNTNAHQCASILASLRDGSEHESSANLASLLNKIVQRDHDDFWPPRKKGVCRDPIKKLFSEASFFASLVSTTGKDPLCEDWEWSRGNALTLLTAASEFAEIYGAKKKALAAVDFSDLEQLALKLLWDDPDHPSMNAREIAKGLRWVYVDEYQDINSAQDRILRALHQPEVKLFMVGDVKQSIYRFRQAAPEIFQNYVKEWQARPGRGSVVFLSANFRSAPRILDFSNRFFTSVMHEKLGGVVFDERARLTCGNEPTAGAIPDEAPREPNVEVLLQIKAAVKSKSHDPAANGESETEAEDLNANEQEALVVAQRLRALHDSEFPVLDAAGCLRPFDWGDAVILLRAPRPKVESYAKIFENAAIPLQAKRIGFYSSIEVLDLTNILALLDNPVQDVPLLSVLRSPLAGLSVPDLVEIRINAGRDASPWHALQKYHREKKGSELWQAVDRFLGMYDRWRQLSRHASLRERLQTIITETHYAEWLSIQPRGRQRLGNVEQLLAIAGEFDAIQRQGIYHFIRFISDQQDASGDIEPAGIQDRNAVRLMSIHQSKGLEFPVVVVADLGKRFNLKDQPNGITLTDRFGFTSQVRPPGKLNSYQSLPGWLARRSEREQSIGEELRMLYVAMTRAKQKLILAGTVSQKTAEGWGTECTEPLAYHRIGQAGNAFEWLGRWLSQMRPNWCESAPESSDTWYWQIGTEAPEADEASATAPDATPAGPFSLPDLTSVINRIEQKYPFEAATARRAKTSVSALRRQLAPDSDAEVKQFVPEPRGRFSAWTEKKLSAVETGAATHLLLEHLDLGSVGGRGWIESEIERLTASRLISQDEIDSIDLKSIEGFWLSPVGQLFLTRREKLRRELPFTLRLPPDRGYVLGALPAARGPVESAQIEHDSSRGVAAAASLGDIAAVRQSSEAERPSDRGYVLGALPAAGEPVESVRIDPHSSLCEAAAASLGDIAAVRQSSEAERPSDRGYVLGALPAAVGPVESAQIEHDSSLCEAAAASLGDIAAVRQSSEAERPSDRGYVLGALPAAGEPVESVRIDPHSSLCEAAAASLGDIAAVRQSSEAERPSDRGYVLGALPAAVGPVESIQIDPHSSPCEAAAASLGDIAAVRWKSEIEDFVVVQGVIDLAMIDSNEIWLLDFKTDRINGSQLEERVASYRPQLEIYKKALQEIYRIPVTETWLHFLSVGETVSL